MRLITSLRQLPFARAYVTYTDVLLSRLEPTRVIMPAKNALEATQLATRARSRADCSNVYINPAKPKLRPGTRYIMRARSTDPDWYVFPAC